MKRLLTIVYFISACSFCCKGQEAKSRGPFCIGTDLVSAICFGTLEVSFKYGFSEHWTAGTELSLDFRHFGKEATSTETGHWESLESDPYGVTDDCRYRQPLINASINFEYWPKGTFKGSCINIGGLYRDRDDADLIIGIGYALKIYKGLMAGVIYNIGILKTYKEKELPYDGFKITLNYAF